MLSMGTKDVTTELDAIANRLRELAAELRGGEEPKRSDRVTAEVSKRLADRVCLQCGSANTERPRRGLCVRCYQATRTRINEGRVTETQLILGGQMAYPGEGDVRRKPQIEDYIRQTAKKAGSGTKKRRTK